MFIQITDAGAQILATGPFEIDSYKLGSALNYIPAPDATDIQGAEVWTGAPGPGVPQSANLIRYSFLLDRSVGDFDFGEIAYFQQGVCVAVAVSSTPIEKRKSQIGVDGNMMRVDAFLSMVGTAYEMWVNLGSTDNRYVLAVLESIDDLPQTHKTIANAYVVGAVAPDQQAFMAYTDRQGLWVFDQYKFSTTINNQYTVTASSPLSVTIAGADLAEDLRPSVFGEKMLQFITGAAYSAVRNIKFAIEEPVDNETVLTFETPLAILPGPGDQFLVYNRDPLAATTINLPVATKDDLGIMQVGEGLEVDQGLVYVDLDWLNSRFVTSVLGKDANGNPVSYKGDVQLHARDIEDSVRTVNGQGPDAQGNVEIVLPTLPVATSTVLGGVRVSPGSGIVIDGTGQISIDPNMFGSGVMTVNGRSPDSAGDLQIIGLIDPVNVSNPDFNTLTTVGLVCVRDVTTAVNGPPDLKAGVLEVTPLSADLGQGVLQVWHTDDSMYWRTVPAFGLPTAWTTTKQSIATTTSLGSVIVGSGLKINVSGVLETVLQNVNGKAPGPSGSVILEALDVGAIPYAEKGVAGGVADLDAPVTPDPIAEIDDYVYGRIDRDMSALETLTYKGEWDALVNAIDLDGDQTEFWVLKDNGIIEYTDGIETYELPGTGSVFSVSVSGPTIIDGHGNWQVGQLVLGLPGRWLKLSLTAPVPVQDYELAATILGPVPASAALFFQSVSRTMQLSATGPHTAVAQAAPSSLTTYDIVVDSVQVGTIDFVTHQGVVNVPAPVVLSPGSTIEILSPADTQGQIGLAFVLTFQI